MGSVFTKGVLCLGAMITICQTKEVTWQAHRRWKCRTELSSADGFLAKQTKMVFSSQPKPKCWHFNIKTFKERRTEITCSLQTQHKWLTELKSPHSRLSREGTAVCIQTQNWGKKGKKKIWAAAVPGFWAIQRVWFAALMEPWLKPVAVFHQCVVRFLQLGYFVRSGSMLWRNLEAAGDTSRETAGNVALWESYSSFCKETTAL